MSALRLRLLLVVLLGVVVVRCAWVSDDAFITLRTLDNLLSGHGLTYNPVERVQAFTHPLWALWLGVPYAITREPWWTTMAVGVLTSAAAVAVLAWGVARDAGAGTLAVALLLSSKAWVDYATSGLEGPLLWLLLALLARRTQAREAPFDARTCLGFAAVGLVRLDGLLLVLPWLVDELGRAWRAHPRALLRAQIGWAPLIAWHLFALAYYGDPLPNTAHAKLGAGIPILELVAQAPHYAAWTARIDPATLPILALGVGLGLAARGDRRLGWALGIVLYLLYVVRIGGDFMGGRFFAGPLFMAAMVVARGHLGPRAAVRIGALALAGSLLSPWAPLRSGPGYTRAPAAHGVVDERGYYWAGTGLWARRGTRSAPSHPFARDGREAHRHPPPTGLVVKSVIGLYGYYAGPEVHIVDRLGLADPLLARLPADRGGDGDPGWRIGHFRRTLPAGYLESVLGDDNRIRSPREAALYERVRLATRGGLWSAARWRAIQALTVDRSAGSRAPAPPRPAPTR